MDTKKAPGGASEQALSSDAKIGILSDIAKEKPENYEGFTTKVDLKNVGVNITNEPFEDNEGGLLIVKPANVWVEEAAKRPDPKPLWGEFWFEGELCCLFADTNVGKSIYAVQIASSIARQRPIIYFDFELSDKQFQLRCTGENGELYTFPDNLYRVEIDPAKMDVTEFENVILNEMERAAITVSAEILIIDNLTWIASNVEKGDAAGILMKNLSGLKRKHGWSILVISHTPKRIMTEPITQNNLNGSKKLANFFDSMFAIGYSAKDDNLRYIKQIKIRYGKSSHGANNVVVAEIEKCGNLVQLKTIGYSTEEEHLKKMTAKDKESIEMRMKELREKGLSYDAISKELGVSKSSVQRYFKQH